MLTQRKKKIKKNFLTDFNDKDINYQCDKNFYKPGDNKYFSKILTLGKKYQLIENTKISVINKNILIFNDILHTATKLECLKGALALKNAVEDVFKFTTKLREYEKKARRIKKFK